MKGNSWVRRKLAAPVHALAHWLYRLALFIRGVDRYEFETYWALELARAKKEAHERIIKGEIS
jgi:hypothetical protein